MAAYTTITVATGKKIVVHRGKTIAEYVAGETVSVPSPDAKRFIAAGLAT